MTEQQIMSSIRRSQKKLRLALLESEASTLRDEIVRLQRKRRDVMAEHAALAREIGERF